MGCLFANRMPERQQADEEPTFPSDEAGFFLTSAWQEQSQAWGRVHGLAKRLDLPLVTLPEIGKPRDVVEQLVLRLEGVT